MDKIKRIPDWVYMILTARVHPLSYIMLSYSAFWGVFAIYLTFLAPLRGITEFDRLFFTNETYASLWGTGLIVVSTLIIVGLHNRIKGLVRWCSHLGLLLWLVMFGAWLQDGYLGLPMLALIHAVSFVYISLASTVNTLDKI